ncbi:MAG: GtrA family protein [Pseudomonadota bacterium]|nr:GtrA family protein [Pseudomonadota bacterium]
MEKFLKFGALSGGGWLLDTGLLLALSQNFGMSLPAANFLSSSIAALSVYTLSRFVVFHASEGRHFFRTLIYFCYTCGVIVAASVLIGPMAWSVQRSADYLSISPTLMEVSFLAKVGITPPQLLANFFVSRYLMEY